MPKNDPKNGFKRDVGKAAGIPRMQQVPQFPDKDAIHEAAPIPTMQRVPTPPKTPKKKS